MLTRRLFSLLGFSVSVVGVGSIARASTPIGRVTESRGPVFAEAERTSRSLDLGGEVFLNDLVRTGQDARAGIVLGERTTLRLGGGVRVWIDRFMADQGGVINLGSGTIGVDTQGPLGRGLSIRSSHALIAVRGTRFIAGAEPGRGFSVLVAEGAVDVQAGGVSVQLAPGEGTTIARPGARPSPVATWASARARRFEALVP